MLKEIAGYLGKYKKDVCMSIDTRTEKIVQNGMDRLMHGRTTFVIAHRLSTDKTSANADADA